MIIHLINLAALTFASIQDFRHEKFNFLIPLAAILASIFMVQDFNIFFFLTYILLIGLGKFLRYFRLGDLVPLTVYMLPFTSIQAFFTLLTGIGVYLYAWPKIFKEKQWVPLIPGITICYLIQLLLF